MINYFLLEQNDKKSTLGLSKSVFETIGSKVLDKIDNIEHENKGKQKGSNCVCSIVFNKINFVFTIVLKDKNDDKELIKNKILELLSEDLLTLLDGIPFESAFKFTTFKTTKNKE